MNQQNGKKYCQRNVNWCYSRREVILIINIIITTQNSFTNCKLTFKYNPVESTSMDI